MTIHDADEYVPAPGEWDDSPTVSEPLGCGYFAPCDQDADHEGPHTAGMYPEWQVPALEPPMAFIHPEAEAAQPIDAERLTDIIEQAIFETGTGLEAALLATDRIIAAYPALGSGTSETE